VNELVEAVAAVVARNPELAITIGVEGAGDPVLLRFAVDDGIVQVSADNPVTAQVTDAAQAAPRHADFDLDLEPVDVSSPAPYAERVRHRSDPAPGGSAFEAESAYAAEAGRSGYEPRMSRDSTPGRSDDYDTPHPYGDPAGYEPPGGYEPAGGSGSSGGFDVGAAGSSDFGPSAERAGRHGDEQPEYEPHPYAATPPPQVPPQNRGVGGRSAGPRQMPEPMPTPIPLREEPRAAEIAAKRLAAMLREDPSLLQVNPHD
jgi:hypothetical protein